MVTKKHIYVIDALILVSTLVVIATVIYAGTPILKSPINGYTTYGPVLFSFEKGEKILIDDNMQFTSPQIIEVRDNLVISLAPGIYYWKVQGALESEVRELTIESKVDLKIKHIEGDRYDVVNSGNTELNVGIFENGSLTGNVILGTDDNAEVSGTEFVGRENA